MLPKLALFAYFFFIVCLFRQARARGHWSKELWLPLIWILIVGSKTPAMWIAVLTHSGRDAEGSSLDTAILIGLLLAGLGVLAKRRTNWQRIIEHNRWLFIYFAYIGISVLWSDQVFSSLKLWVKDVGNLIMVMVVLSDPRKGEAVKATLLRASYVLIPISVLLIKYFPEIGRGYDRWTYQPIMLGANDSKNTLGATILVCTLVLLSNVFDRQAPKWKSKVNIATQLALVLMTLWLLLRSNCATALACAIVGVLIFVLMRGDLTRRVIQRFGLSIFIIVPLLSLFLQYVLNLGEVFAGALGRDLTLTARTDIWQLSFDADVNPLIGSGYSSFWYGERAHRISEKLGFFYNLKEAHNGYLETYLNSGVLGVIFLVCSLATGTARILKGQSENASHQTARLVCVVVALIYNVSESAFAGLNLIWFILVLMLLEWPPQMATTTHRGRSFSRRELLPQEKVAVN